MKLTLKGNSDSLDGTFTLKATSLFNSVVYTSPVGNEKITLPRTWKSAELPEHLYVDAKSFSSSATVAAANAVLTLTYKQTLLTGPSAFQLEDSVRVRLLPVEVSCPEIYMFSGHENDVVELCKVSGITCEWKLKSSNPAIGTFDHPTDTACSFTATTPGKNTIQLLIGGLVVWEKPVEVLPIISRATWGAVAPKSHTLSMSTIKRLTLHHTSNSGTGIAEMQRIQNKHMSLAPFNLPFAGGNNFDDIGYHLVMDKNGDVYEGRQIEGPPGILGGPFTKGEHVANNNTEAGFGLCTMGDYEVSEGNEPWLPNRQEALEKVITAVCRRYHLKASQISYHQAMALPSDTRTCPGSNFIPSVSDIIKNVGKNLQ